MGSSLRKPCRLVLLGLGLLLMTAMAPAQESPRATVTLPRSRFRAGDDTLKAFQPVSQATRHSIVKLNVDGETVALGTVVDSAGFALTKASEIRKGKLTCWLATDKEVPAEIVATDEDLDVALVRIRTRGLKPIEWSTEDVVPGQWAITPGIAETPHGAGIISAHPRRIRPQRALIGVQFAFGGDTPRIEEIMAGLGAEKAGLKAGDIITGVNGKSMETREEVVEALREFREGQAVKISVKRADTLIEVEIRLMLPKVESVAGGGNSRQRMNRLAGEVSLRAEGFEEAIEHDTVLQPWLCGGPLVNLDGKAVGLNIARAGRVSTYALPAALVQKVIQKLRSASQT